MIKTTFSIILKLIIISFQDLKISYLENKTPTKNKTEYGVIPKKLLYQKLFARKNLIYFEKIPIDKKVFPRMKKHFLN